MACQKCGWVVEIRFVQRKRSFQKCGCGLFALRKVRTAFLNTPAELAGDLFDRGAVLLGGGARLPGLDIRLRESTGLPVFVGEGAENAVDYAHGP